MSMTYRSQELVAVSRHFSDEIDPIHAEEGDGSKGREHRSVRPRICVSVNPSTAI